MGIHLHTILSGPLWILSKLVANTNVLPCSYPSCLSPATDLFPCLQPSDPQLQHIFTSWTPIAWLLPVLQWMWGSMLFEWFVLNSLIWSFLLLVQPDRKIITSVFGRLTWILLIAGNCALRRKLKLPWASRGRAAGMHCLNLPGLGSTAFPSVSSLWVLE